MNVFEWILSIYLGIGVVIMLISLINIIVTKHLNDFNALEHIQSVLGTIFLWPYIIYVIFTDKSDNYYD